VQPTPLTKGERWYRVPQRRVHFMLRGGADLDPTAVSALGPAPVASRRLKDCLHDYLTKDLSSDERSAPGHYFVVQRWHG
ncbi:hypothetical protein RA266_28635, partial [Pseudomonas syringae pv. tagetis]